MEEKTIINESNKVRLYLMRHGQTIINRAERVQGWCDGVLTEEGIEVAESVALGLSDVNFKAIYCSDLGRAVKTANIVLKANRTSSNLEVKELPELREMYFGKFEGELEELMFGSIFKELNITSLEEALNIPNFGRAFADTCAALDETGAAENYDTLISRIKKGINRICEEVLAGGGGNVLVVVHGGMLRNFINDIDQSADISDIKNSSVTLVEYEKGKFNIVAINDMSYKEKGESLKQKL